MFLFLLGIGKETARDLAKRGARLIMACRNMETGTKARGIKLIKYVINILYCMADPKLLGE